MSTKHTPGPWHYFRQGTKHFIAQQADGEFRYAIVVVHEATYHPGGILAARLEAEANARLIAAAPDLLAALEDIEQAWRDDSPTFSAAVERGRAAIARAKGEA